MGSPIRVIVADDQSLVRGAIAMMLGLEDDIDVVGQAAHGQELLEILEGIAADVALIDVEMPEMDGITAAREIHQRWPQIKVLMVTTFGKPGYLRRAMEAGASGFVVKDAPAQSLATAVRKVMAGQRVVDADLAAESLTTAFNPLTQRERDVLSAAATGATASEIAKKLFLSQGTVRNHLSSAIQKTGARTRVEAAIIARDNGWL
ncbi:response regulator transcription factor [Actinobaculum sp. 352]|uniref:response regulator transcription factor n=1 Tax=Actinobaculum sp. 352 TaxID=2490946 RepID=UPI000F7F4430|nr:response regulator transcription factor [Actinobaculum sp. 352]RTE49212.1 response regulator transcription factor [Actinobaculum sp. 352]